MARPRGQRGLAYVLALLFLAVFAALAAAMTAVANRFQTISETQASVQGAQAQAEGGLDYILYVTKSVSLSTEPAIDSLAAHLSAKLGSPPAVSGAVSYSANTITISSASPAGCEGSFAAVITADDATTLTLRVTGAHRGVTRTVSMQLEVVEDTSVLSYAVTSKVRTIVRGDVNVEGDLYSSWTRTGAAVPFDIQLGTDGDITGEVKTVLTQTSFEGDSCQNAVDSNLHEKLSYEAPAVADYNTDDFDTAPILDLMTNTGGRNPLPAASASAWEKWPNNSNGTWFNRPQYVNQTLSWTHIPKNTHARFKNCTFTGITYIDSEGTSKTQGNNIVFENCTFEGPVVTNVPSTFDWKYNSLYFEGDTEFKPSEIAEHLDGCTILAPNFNVNIGDFNKQGVSSDSKITGILVGGIVDIRDNALIEGTILSMANLDHVSDSSAFYYGTNLGYWENDYEESGGVVPMTANITIRPQPGTKLPLGIRKRYTLARKAGTYREGS